MMIGHTLGHYRVLEKLGAGGMGVVYRGHDEQLDRDVALKVLPPEALADETARARLLREARLASKLNHPHICTVFEVGEADGKAYIAMELVEGHALSARLAEGALPVQQVLRYGQQLADALAHAHAKRVVHRDFKSANVVVTPEGRAKVLDFGLARRLTDEQLAEATVSQLSLTAPGAVTGTLAYMAPEQLRGQPADERSDIWALGVVLYEMAGGRRPFQGRTGFELTSAILNESPAALPPAVPEPLQAVVARCLAKDPGDRYQRGSDVLAALEAVQAGTTVEARRLSRRRRLVPRLGLAAGAAILAALLALVFGFNVGGLRSRLMGGPRTIRLAVLPFANLSGDAAQAYLSDGLTQEMITQLGRLHPETLSVIARTSVMRYKNRDAPIDQIGRELGVDYVLEGGAQRQAERIHVAAALIRVADQTQVWADKYERDVSAIMTVQSHVAQNVAKALAVRLLPAEEARLAIVRTINPEAYDAYLQGSTRWQTMRAPDIDEAQRHFEQALAKDPSYAPALSGLAWVWLARAQFGLAPPGDAGRSAKAATLQALALDDNSAEAHEALASILTWNEWNWAGAQREWQRTFELNPNSANAHAYYAHYLAHMGRAGEGLSYSERAIRLDPFNALYHSLHGMVLVYLRRYDDALAAARAAISFDVEMSVAYSVIQRVYLCKGMREEQLADQRLRIARDPERVAAFERGLAEGGYEGAQRAIADVLAARWKDTPYLAVGVAMRYNDAGDKERAIAWLQKAYDGHDQELAYLGMCFWDPLRSDPRFQALLRRVGLPQ